MSNQPTNKIVKFDGQIYLVNDIKISEVCFEYDKFNSILRVKYCGNIYSEKAFRVKYINGKPDFKSESELYVAIVELNRRILQDKKA